MSCHVEITDHAPARISLEAAIGERFLYWYGASGEGYLHTVFTPETCPILDNAGFISVYRDAHGARHVLNIGILSTPGGRAGPMRNQVEHLFSGANEVHLHLLSSSSTAADKVHDDLARRHLTPCRAAG